MSVPATRAYAAQFGPMAHLLPGRAAWLQAFRSDALERFVAEGLPTPRDEDWKYTSVAPLEKRIFTMAMPEVAQHADAIAALVRTMAIEGSHRLVFVNGRYAPGLSAIGVLPAGAHLGNVAGALETGDERMREALGQRTQETAFGDLNAAFMTDGLYLRLAAGVAIDAPVHVLFIAADAGHAVQARNVILAEARSGATVIEQYVAVAGAAQLTNVVTQVHAAEGARLVHCKVQEESPQALHIAGTHAIQAAGSRWVSHSIAFGAALARNDISTVFDAPDCEVTLNGLYVVGGRQHVDHHTRVDHAQPRGTSREYYRGVLDGRARGVFNGKVVVHPQAQGTDAQQANHNLLLSRDAEVDTKPELEIWADDVKCTHGATVGQLDDNQIFYLRSRGMDEHVARSVLTYAFALDVVQRIEVPAVRERLGRTLLARLPEGERIKELA